MHARNVVYLNDDKYAKNGVYFFATTWDCKKDDNNIFLYSYKYFANTKELFNEYDFENNLIDITFYNFSINKAWEVGEFLIDDRYKDIPNNYITAINKISKIIDDGQLKLPNIFNNMPETLVQNKDNIYFIINKIYDYTELLNQQIDLKKILKAFYNVRRCQYSENPKKYPFDIQTFKEIINSFCDKKIVRPSKKNNLDKKVKQLKILIKKHLNK